jgi:hypothetical protein
MPWIPAFAGMTTRTGVACDGSSGSIEDFCNQTLAKVRALSISFGVIPLGEECAETFGELKAILEEKGTPLDDFDLAIAATALARNFTLVTNKNIEMQAAGDRHQHRGSDTLHQGARAMITDTEIRIKGLQVLAKYLGDIEAERFVSLIQREPFDYTKWREGLDEDLTIEEISRRAMALKEKHAEQEHPADTNKT